MTDFSTEFLYWKENKIFCYFPLLLYTLVLCSYWMWYRVIFLYNQEIGDSSSANMKIKKTSLVPQVLLLRYHYPIWSQKGIRVEDQTNFNGIEYSAEAHEIDLVRRDSGEVYSWGLSFGRLPGGIRYIDHLLFFLLLRTGF